jgi:hypothetical protein
MRKHIPAFWTFNRLCRASRNDASRAMPVAAHAC